MKKSKEKEKTGKYKIVSVISIAVFLAIWEVCTDILHLAPASMLPSPISVLETFIQKLYDPSPDGATMIEHMAASMEIALIGYVLGALVGIPLAILMGWYENIDMFVRPLFDLLRPIPGIAWIPIFIILFGIGTFSRAVVIFISSFISCVVNTYTGIKQTKQVHLWVGQTFGASNTQLLVRVAIPSALPMIITGLKVALGASWSALVAAELLASTKGLGFMIQQCRGIFRPDVIIAGMIAIGGIGAFLTYLLSLLEKAILKGGRW